VGSDLPDAWDQAVDDVVGFVCAKFTLDPSEVRKAIEEVLQAAQEGFKKLGHFCPENYCRCRAEMLVQVRAFVEAKVLAINSVDAQVFAVERFNQYLDERN
jgi:hypothetical protein